MRLVASFCAIAASCGSLLFAVPAAAQDDPIVKDDELRAVPVLRLAAGPAVNVYPDTRAQFMFESTLGVSALQGIIGVVALNFEAGYTLDTGGDRGAFHGANVTVGLGYGNVAFAFLYRPRLLVGTYNDSLAVGMRNGIGLHLAADLASVELAHQFLNVNEAPGGGENHELRHDVVLLLAVNPFALAYLWFEADDALH